MSRSPIHPLEKDAEERAREFKRRLIEDGMRKLAAEEAARVSPPEGYALPPHPSPPDDAVVVRRPRDG